MHPGVPFPELSTPAFRVHSKCPLPSPLLFPKPRPCGFLSLYSPVYHSGGAPATIFLKKSCQLRPAPALTIKVVCLGHEAGEGVRG